MKKIQLSRHEIPFQLDQHYHQDAQLVLSLQDGIMFIENVYGIVLHSFNAIQSQIDWFNSFLDYRYIEIVPEAQVAVVTAKELANTCIRLAGEPGAKQPTMENSPKKCFKLFSQRVVDGFYVHLYNETYENPEQSYDMWQGHDASQERCIFLSDQDGSLYEGLWAEDWESAKNAFHRTHANAYELDKNTLLARVWDEQ
jgi:hypothetical protein